MCATMYRIDLAHLCWSLENLAAGTPVNIIEVDEETAAWSLVALERMLSRFMNRILLAVGSYP